MSKGIHDGHRQRMKNRFLSQGLKGFDSHQIMEMLLFYGIPRIDTNELAHRLIDTFGGLPGVLKADYDDLVKVPGMSANAATLVTFTGQIIREYYDSNHNQDNILDSLDKIGNHILPKFFGEKNERVLLLCMDNKCKVLYSGFVSEGTVNATEISVRKVMEQALRSHALAVVVAHNHPSGFALPSREDQETTTKLVNALAVAGIHLIDHIVVAEDDYISMRSTPALEHLFRRPKPD